MAGLQRSSETFRRSGSSGMVWEWDDKHLSGEIKPAAGRGADDGGAEAAAVPRVERSKSSGHGGSGYRAAGRVPPPLDPPSPRVAVCGGCCSFLLGGKAAKKKNQAKARRQRR